MKGFTRQEKIEYWTEKVLMYESALEKDGNRNTRSLLEYAQSRITELVNQQADAERRLKGYRDWIKRSLERG